MARLMSSLGLGLLCVLLSACGTEAETSADASAHVLQQFDSLPEHDIVESTRTYRVAERPELVIGDTHGDPLFQVRDVLLNRRGELVIADGGSAEIRVFDKAGRFVRSFGRNGEGPGEFANLTGARLTADTVVVYDNDLGRITWFTHDGQWIREQRLVRPVVAEHEFLGIWRGQPMSASMGTIIARTARRAPPRLAGARRDTMRLLSFDTLGENYTVVAQVAGRENYGAQLMLGGGGTAVVQAFFGFQRSARAATDGTLLAYGATDLPRLVIVTPGGARAVRWAARPEPFTNEYLRVLRDTIDAQIASERADRRTRLVLDQTPKPATLPAWDRLLMTVDGSIWVRMWAWPNAETRVWRVLDNEGRETGKVQIPSELDVRAVAPDRIAVLRRDELGVQSVAVYLLLPN